MSNKEVTICNNSSPTLHALDLLAFKRKLEHSRAGSHGGFQHQEPLTSSACSFFEEIIIQAKERAKNCIRSAKNYVIDTDWHLPSKINLLFEAICYLDIVSNLVKMLRHKLKNVFQKFSLMVTK